MSTPRVKPGDVLGAKYKVERILGAGGMGIVVAAKHIDLGQLVALKFMLKEAMSEPGHAERFLREAKSAVQLKSAHTARVLDVGRLKNGEPFMVMEYLAGRDLDAELQARGPLSPHVAVDYVLQASEALAEAHGLGMIHRDVKLKNMFLTTTVDGRPLVKMLDFGLAKTLGAHGDVSLTATNSVFGSPQYMSPEQMRSAKDVDARSDIWSMGVCLYELLTGRVPFDAQGVAEICAMVLKDPVPPPSQFARGLPADLEAVVLKCLEKDVTRRYQSIAELAFALQGYAADEGSARRILHVMQAAQKVEHPTIVTHNAPAIDGEAKTMNAWNSNLPSHRTTNILSRTQMVAVLIGVALMGLIGAAATILAIQKRSHPAAASSGIVATAELSGVAPAGTDPITPPVSPSVVASATPNADPTEPPPATTDAPGASEAQTSKPGAVVRPKPTTGPTHAAPPTTAKTAAVPTPATTPPAKPPTKPKGGPGAGGEYM